MQSDEPGDPPDPEPEPEPGPAALPGPPTGPGALSAATEAVLRPVRSLLALVTPSEPPLELQIVGRTLLHAALVGLGAGAIAVAFFAGGVAARARRPRAAVRLRAAARPRRGHVRRGAPASRSGLWLLALVPAVGALIGGLIMRLAPETNGGGGDAAIEAFHHHDGVVRRRVIWVKTLASIFTLGTGGSGGREGPTMQVGGALGSTVGRYLKVIGARAPRPHGRRRRGRHLGGVPRAARRRAARDRDAVQATTSRPRP